MHMPHNEDTVTMQNNIGQHTLSKSVILHLLPGFLVGGFYFLIVPLVKAYGFPSIMALTLAGVIVLIPFELGFLLYQKYSLRQKLRSEVIKYCKPMPIWQYFVWVLVVFVLSGLIFTAVKFTSDFFVGFFKWIPSERLLDMGLTKEFTKQKLIITYGVSFLFLALIVPTIEELYFRGYLLPRMPSRLKGWAVPIHSALFALYHVWTPWMFFVRALGLLPLVYVVKWKENVLIGIIAHCQLNSLDFIIGFAFIANY